MEDNHIIKLLFARSESAITALARRFGRRLQALAENILGSRRDAEECVSDTYLVLWNRIPPERPQPLAPYVYKVGRNTALKRLRTNSAQKRDSAYDLSLDELAGCLPDDSTERRLQARELGRAIDRFLDTQSKSSRVIFLRRYWFGDGIGEISKATGISPGAVTTRLSRTRSALKDYLTQEGFYDETRAY